MAVFNAAFPVLPGQAEAFRAFAKETAGTRLAGFAAQQKRQGVTRETWSLQETPMGAFVLVWFEGSDPAAALADLATAGDEFAVWFRAQVLANNGVDLTQPGGALPEIILDWRA